MSSTAEATSTGEETQLCLICATLLRVSLRYPRHVCGACSARAVDGNGRALSFYNSSMSGGFEAAFTDDGKPAEEVMKSHIAFVDGVRVWVDEARFGGIVLEIYAEGDEKREA